MRKSIKSNGKVAAFRPSPEPLFPRPPFLARNPWVGFLIFIVATIGFLIVTQQVVTHGPLTRWDQPVAVAVFNWAKQQPASVVLYMRFFSAYGRDGVALIALVLTVGWVRRKARRELWMLFFGVLGGELWFQVISNFVLRPRPSFKDPFETLIGAGFPSGHAATNVLLGWMVLYLLWPHIHSAARRFWLTFAVVFIIASVLFSRMFLGLHWPTDIIGGVLLGFAWGGLIYTITDLHFFREQKQADFVPEAVPVTGEEETTRKR
jgi:membrane-associated phospholipid phosphatase